MTDRPHIDIDPAVRNGEPCIAGTRLPALQMACEWIEGGWTFEELQYEYPTLTREGLLIACWYIAQEHPLSWRFWYQWHARAQEALAEGRYADVPLPPQKASVQLGRATPTGLSVGESPVVPGAGHEGSSGAR